MNKEAIAFFDCEASSLGKDSYPIEIGWCLADTGAVASCLIAPADGWTDWDPEAERVHGITHATLRTDGISPPEAAERLCRAVRGRTLYADSFRDVEWLHKLCDLARVQAPAIKPFDRLLEIVVRSEVDAPGDALARDLARAELQGELIDAAYSHALRTAPKTHRAGQDARHLHVVFEQVLRLQG